MKASNDGLIRQVKLLRQQNSRLKQQIGSLKRDSLIQQLNRINRLREISNRKSPRNPALCMDQSVSRNAPDTFPVAKISPTFHSNLSRMKSAHKYRRDNPHPPNVPRAVGGFGPRHNFHPRQQGNVSPIHSVKGVNHPLPVSSINHSLDSPHWEGTHGPLNIYTLPRDNESTNRMTVDQFPSRKFPSWMESNPARDINATEPQDFSFSEGGSSFSPTRRLHPLHPLHPPLELNSSRESNYQTRFQRPSFDRNWPTSLSSPSASISSTRLFHPAQYGYHNSPMRSEPITQKPHLQTRVNFNNIF